MDHLIAPIAQQLGITVAQIKNTLALLQEGNTVPFIARYRKEMTKGLDEEQIRIISEQYEYQVNLEKRKEDVARLIETQGKLTEEIKAQLAACAKLSQVEDIYRPYQQKRKTRATDAIAKGLKPLAEWILTLPKVGSLNDEASKYVNEKVINIEEAIQGAKDIIAEIASDNVEIRNKIQDSMNNYGKIITKEKKKHEDERKVYKMYYDFMTRVSSVPNHCIMAMDRAESEKVITVNIEFDEQFCINWAIRKFNKNSESIVSETISEAVSDGIKRLAIPSIERGIRNELSERAQASSIDVFSMNLERLLLQPPMKNKTVLGFDPAFRTGCKLAVIDKTGKMLEVSVIYPHQPNAKVQESKRIFLDLCTRYPIDIIAIGNGTASRESESFVANFIKENKLNIAFTMVSEAGASVYSASKLAREEFPELHVEQRSAISIARRIMDPLAELIKIDPQSIGVGQYQHDLPVTQLKQRLDFVVSKAVNLVGVNVNTASAELLKNISGLSAASAKSIIDFRETVGMIATRKALTKIPKIGAKSFQQAAGFLRIEDGSEILDRTSIHPESYEVCYKLLKELGIKAEEIGTEIAIEKCQNANQSQLMTSLQVDEYTLNDIFDSIQAPLRDYRDNYDAPLLRNDILELEDLKVNEKLEGTVRNVVDFGAFVDIGLHEDGLVHISNLSKEKVSHPSVVVAVGDIITVWVKKIDEEKQKVQLTMIEPNI